MSVGAPILEGENDAELKWPIIRSYFTLLNHKNHHTKVFCVSNPHDIYVLKILGATINSSHSALAHDPVKNTQYSKMTCRVEVEVANHKLWLYSELTLIL